ncbi:MAG TPA: hypothetical protein VFO60_07265, partial [Candidatus Dormibacteraeota bacterium]|nr:hypothetical protein [Candidatus Dormibacteraeota bacterium]
MDHLSGSPSASAPHATAGGGDVLAVLVRRWIDLASETMPGDGVLTELLTSRLLEVAGRGTPPSEAELLDVAEEAAQHAVGQGSPDAARLLSKRLRRAIYEYLLSIDAVSQASTYSGRTMTGAGSDDALASAMAQAGRGGNRPELVWDEPALRVLEGGARAADAGRAHFSAHDRQPVDSFDAPDDHDPVDAATGQVPPAFESGVEDQPEAAAPVDVVEDDAVASEAEEAPATAASDDPESEEPAAQALEPEALRVPERFRRDEPAMRVEIDDPPYLVAPHDGDVEPSLPAPATPAEPPPIPEAPATADLEPAAAAPAPAAAEPRAPGQAPAAVVVPSYRAWADVLASDEPVPGDKSPAAPVRDQSPQAGLMQPDSRRPAWSARGRAGDTDAPVATDVPEPRPIDAHAE